jgi:hypothetical protein
VKTFSSFLEDAKSGTLPWDEKWLHRSTNVGNPGVILHTSSEVAFTGKFAWTGLQ